MPIGKEFAKRFKHLRKDKKISQKEVASALGLTWQRVLAKEKSGRILLDEAEIMAFAIDESLSKLLGTVPVITPTVEAQAKIIMEQEKRIRELEAKLPVDSLVKDKSVIITGGDTGLRRELADFILRDARKPELDLLSERIAAIKRRRRTKDNKGSSSETA